MTFLNNDKKHSRLILLWAIPLGLASVSFGCSLTIDEDALAGGDGMVPDDGDGGSGPLECGANQKICTEEGEEQCVDFDDPDFGCSNLTCAPCTLSNATPTCSKASGQCVIAACQGLFKNCNDADSDGCEVDINTDEQNCGGCDNECPQVDNAEVSCGGAQCFIRICDTGFADCNDNFEDGCEVDLNTSNDHCGECGMPCSGECVDGECMSGT